MRQLYLKDKTIKRDPPQWESKKNVYYYLNEQEQKQPINRDLLDVTQVDKAISKLIDKLNEIPTMKQMGVELETDLKEHRMNHSLIFKQLAKITKLKSSVEEIIQRVYKERTKQKKSISHKGKPIRQSTYEFLEKESKKIESALPTDKEKMDELQLDKSERSNPAIHSLIWLCKKEFKDKQNFLA